jgi:hypothetical protein
MTQKQGLAAGSVIGALAWLILNGYIVFAPALTMFKALVGVIAGSIFILSIIVFVVSTMRGKAVFGTTGDYFLYGFTAVFDVLFIVINFYHGILPIP